MAGCSVVAMACRLQLYLDDVTEQAWKSIPPEDRDNQSAKIQEAIRAEAVEGGFWVPPGGSRSDS